MLTAVVAHPPVFGAKAASVDDSTAKAIKGVQGRAASAGRPRRRGVAVIADGYWPAKQGRDALKIDWDTGAVEKVDSAKQLAEYRELATQPGRAQVEADMSPLGRARRTRSRRVRIPLPGARADGAAQLHGRPRRQRRPTCGSARRFQTGDQAAAAQARSACKPEQVTVNTQMAGGGFGRRAVPTTDYVVEAVNVAKAAQAAGRTRRCARCGAARTTSRAATTGRCTCTAPTIGFDAQGKIVAWDHVIVGQSITRGHAVRALHGQGRRRRHHGRRHERAVRRADEPDRASPPRPTCRCCGGVPSARPTPPS